MSRRSHDPALDIAMPYCKGFVRPDLLAQSCAEYLRGNYSFFGSPSEPHHRMLLVTAGVDVEAMVREYRNRAI